MIDRTKTVNTICGPFDHKRAQALKTAYEEAVEENRETFTFSGGVLDVKFTKYLLEFLTNENLLNK